MAENHTLESASVKRTAVGGSRTISYISTLLARQRAFQLSSSGYSCGDRLLSGKPAEGTMTIAEAAEIASVAKGSELQLSLESGGAGVCVHHHSPPPTFVEVTIDYQHHNHALIFAFAIAIFPPPLQSSG